MPELKRFLLGRRLTSDETHQTKLNNFVGLSVFSSDALSSVAYATQEIMASLSMALPHGVAAVSVAGFVQPLLPHEHWHVDVSYINICGTFYYLCSVLDGCSCFIAHWEIRQSMTEADIEIIIQRAKEAFPDARLRVISDNGPQFIAKDFKEFIRISGMTHVRTSPFYPQSNGKIERWHKSLKTECIRPGTPLSLDDARRLVGQFVDHYNGSRLHSAIGFVTPRDKLEGRDKAIFAERDHKLEAAREQRKLRRQVARMEVPEQIPDMPQQLVVN